MSLSLHTTTEHRSFEAACLGAIDSRPFLPCKDGELRPVLITFACNAQVFRPFMANVYERRPLELRYLRGGARSEPLPVVMLKSAGYELTQQLVPGREYRDESGHPVKEPDRIVGTYYTPNAFTLEAPNAETERCDFIMVPTAAQLADNVARLDNKAIVTHLMRTNRSAVPADMWRSFGALACLWAGYVDRRAHAPMIQEPAFFAHAFYDAIAAGVCKLADKIDPTNPDYRSSGGGMWGRKDFPEVTAQTRTYGLDRLGFHDQVFINFASEADMQTILARSIQSYSAAVAGACADTVELPEGL